MLLSTEVHYFKQKIVIVLLVVLAYLPHVITNIVPNANDLSKQNTSMKKVPFVEYYIEHNVSEGAAKQSFFEVGVKLIDGAYLLLKNKTVQTKQFYYRLNMCVNSIF